MRLAHGLVVVALGCAPKKSVDSAAAAERPPVQVVSVPAPLPDDDAGVLSNASPQASAEESSDAGPFAGLRPDAAAQPAALSPPLPVKFGAVFRQPADPLFGAELVLFSRRVSCAEAARQDHPERVFALSAEWAAPYSTVSMVVSFKNGVTTSYRAKLEVIAAPPRVGALGKIALAKGVEYNVGGGEVDVLVCR